MHFPAHPVRCHSVKTNQAKYGKIQNQGTFHPLCLSFRSTAIMKIKSTKSYSERRSISEQKKLVRIRENEIKAENRAIRSKKWSKPKAK